MKLFIGYIQCSDKIPCYILLCICISSHKQTMILCIYAGLWYMYIQITNIKMFILLLHIKFFQKGKMVKVTIFRLLTFINCCLLIMLTLFPRNAND